MLDNIPLENIDFNPNDEVMGGVNEHEVFGAEISDFETIAAPPSLETATSLSESATISTAHIFKTGRGFHRIAIFSDTGTVVPTQLGTKQQIAMQNAFTGAISADAQGRGYVRKYKNRAMIFLVRERSGRLVQLGSKNSPARLAEITGGSGAAAGDANNLSLVFHDAQPYVAPLYEGTIQEFPAPAPDPVV